MHDEVTLEFLVKTMSADRVMLGSDYPFPLGEQLPGALVHGSKSLTDAERDKILAGNACEFLGLNRADYE